MTIHGKLLPEQSIESAFLEGRRTVRLYLPPSYEHEPRRRYPVLYLHDGQNVFSSAGPDACFGWGNWELDLTVDRLVRLGRMREIIMVGVDHGRSRYREYRGRLPGAGGSPKGRRRTKAGANPENEKFEAYAKFLMKELKPRIDREFRTLRTASTTGTMGSSMGGLCSLALGWEFPKVFGRVACLSGSFQVEHHYFVEQVLKVARGRAKPVKLYLDSGTVDHGGDDDSRADTETVAHELRRLGWKEGRTLMHYTDLRPLADDQLERAGLPKHKWHEARSSQHNEFYWKLRSWRPLEFLFPPLK